MKKQVILLSLLLSTTCFAAKDAPVLFGRPDQMRIVVNNRILTDVNGKPVSVMDVMKKMDLRFHQQYPQYANNPAAKIQYYQVNWKPTLDELVERELILADAKESKMEVTSSDVREEIEKMFGPNIIENLDSIGISYDEAKVMVQDDLMIKRMSYYRINMKANQSVSPKDVRIAYEAYAKENIRPDIWRYTMISVRGKDATKNAETANHIHQLLAKEGVALSELQQHMESHGYIQEGVTFTISEPFEQSGKEVAEANLNILKEVENGEYSFPVAQRSRVDNNMLFRIFYLQEKVPGGAIPFLEAEPEIRNQLLEESMRIEREKYFSRLRKHYNVPTSEISELLPEDFQPFSLQ